MPEPNLSCKFVRFVVKKLIKFPRFYRFAFYVIDQTFSYLFLTYVVKSAV